MKPGQRIAYWTRRPGEAPRLVHAIVRKISLDGRVARVEALDLKLTGVVQTRGRQVEALPATDRARGNDTGNG